MTAIARALLCAFSTNAPSTRLVLNQLALFVTAVLFVFLISLTNGLDMSFGFFLSCASDGTSYTEQRLTVGREFSMALFLVADQTVHHTGTCGRRARAEMSDLRARPAAPRHQPRNSLRKEVRGDRTKLAAWTRIARAFHTRAATSNPAAAIARSWEPRASEHTPALFVRNEKLKPNAPAYPPSRRAEPTS